MAINRVSLTAESLTTNTDITLELLVTRPEENVYMDTPVTPNRLVGFYNAQTGTVELYLSDNTGYRYLRVR